MRVHWPLTILLAAAVLPAHAGDAGLRWLVAPDDDLAAWQQAAAAVWPGNGLAVERWVEAWPPEPADPPQGSFAYLSGPSEDGSVVLRSPEGGVRQVRVDEADITSTGARRRVLLILHSMVHPIAVADNGWLPDSVEVVATTADDAEAVTRATAASDEAARRKTPFLAEGAVGMTYRRGLDSPALAPAVRVGIQLGAYPRFRLLFMTEISADLLGQVELAGIGTLFNGASVLVGNELRFGSERISVPVRFGFGMRVLWVHRTDNRASDQPAMVPSFRGGAGLAWRVRPGVQGVAGFVLGADLITGTPPIRIVSSDPSAKGIRALSQLFLGAQFGFAFGSVLEPMKDPPR